MRNNFITNAKDSETLHNRLGQLIEVSSELKFLVGFFYFSGLKTIYEKIKENEDVTIKILVGLDVEKHIKNIVEVGISDSQKSTEEHFSSFVQSMDRAINSPEMDNREFYEQVHFFADLIKTGRLNIRKTFEPNHAKLYLFKVKENNFGIDAEFITGSSNLTKAGLLSQNEFNVEIRDYGFESAEQYFDDLWSSSVPITEVENYKNIIIDFIKNKTLASYVTPFEAYAFVLKTFVELQSAKNTKPFLERLLEGSGFRVYKYQLDAVSQALNILETYNGVIIADVVGLGKSVIASSIAKQIGKRGIVICPPGLIGDKNQSTGWWEYLNKFGLYDWDIESVGKIEELAESLSENDKGYEVVIVDEAHRFRNQDTAAYEALSNICRAKKVILLTATPFNNTPADIFSLLKLFIIPGESGITVEQDIESRFASYNSLFASLSEILKNGKSTDKEKRVKAEKIYTKLFNKKPPIDFTLVKNTAKTVANEIKGVISPVVIRRNRLDLKNDYEYRQEIQNLSDVDEPNEIFYELTEKQLKFYDEIIGEYFAEDGVFKGAIYKPYEYEKGANIDTEDNRTLLQQRNLYDFMRRLLVKRFESSFGAFAKSIDRFLKVHTMVLKFIKQSNRYILDRKVIESIYNEEDADSFILNEIEDALKKFKENAVNHKTPKHTKIYEVDKFKRKKQFLNDIENDLKLFENIKRKIDALKLVENDPKLQKVIMEIKGSLAKEEKRKIVLFSEYTDTINYLKEKLDRDLYEKSLFCAGSLTKSLYTKINENFNAQYRIKKNEYNILITTDKLSEGVNLNKAGLIINYDIPWNPTRVIQRLGRINRIGTKVFERLYIYNFFPTKKGADIVKSREIASQKMFLIHNALGEDSKIFDSSEEPTESGLFKKINSAPDENEEEGLLTFARNELKKIEQEHPETVERIKQFPNRIKTAKAFRENNVVLVRKKGLALFSLIGKKSDKKIENSEIPLEAMFDFIKCDYKTKKLEISSGFWELYDSIKQFKPKRKSGFSGISIENKAINSLKSLLKNAPMDENTAAFINTLIKDIRKYKTLAKYTLRKLVLDEDSPAPYENLTESIQELKRKLGEDYLENIIKKAQTLDDDIIIAIENKVQT